MYFCSSSYNIDLTFNIVEKRFDFVAKCGFGRRENIFRGQALHYMKKRGNILNLSVGECIFSYRHSGFSFALTKKSKTPEPTCRRPYTTKDIVCR